MISNKHMLTFSVLNHLMLKIQLILRGENNHLLRMASMGVTYNGYLNISKVSTCIVCKANNVILQYKVDEKVKGALMQI